MYSKKLASEAMIRALQIRQSGGVRPRDAVCVFDFIDRLGIELRFVEINSMEGMYRKRPEPLIAISSVRPPGRQAFTCAHELGHHVFGHGSHIDDLIDETRTSNYANAQEFIADTFASFFLMPKLAVSHAFARRGWDPQSCTALQIYTVAGWLGVGYTALAYHMANSLRLISHQHADELSKIRLPQIRSQILGRQIDGNLVVVDAHWDSRSVDAQVGELLLLPAGTISESPNVRLVGEDSKGTLYCAAMPGVGRFLNPTLEWASYVRVSRRSFVGRSIYRHLEESDEEDDGSTVE